MSTQNTDDLYSRIYYHLVHQNSGILKYDQGGDTQNAINSPINYNKLHRETYNFKIGDTILNQKLHKLYKHTLFPHVSTHLPQLTPIQQHILQNDINFELMKPQTIHETNDSYDLCFKTPTKSKIFSDAIPSSSNTEFLITEQKNINKQDHAFVTLLFPNYDQDNNKKYDYLIGTLLVAYLLKTTPQNYGRTSQNKIGTNANVVCMVTPDVDQSIIIILKIYYDDVITVPYIAWNNVNLPSDIKNNPTKFIEIQDISKGNIKPNQSYNKVMTKLNMLNKQLIPYKKVIFLDTDLFPLGYFDSLFSIAAPAGCIEHRRLQFEDLGISSWAVDRGCVCKHGKNIPKEFTDIENIQASDVNASLLIMEPNNKEYQDIITELKSPLDTWFGKDKQHKGFWLGNNLYAFYFLPEQNYLTKRYSGKWNSVDLGFTSWLLDLQYCFGFTFAGFLVKPWKTQSGFHKYSINPYSLFSKINNKESLRAYGYQLMNNMIYKMCIHLSKISPNNYEHVKNEIKNMIIVFTAFDPWETEINLSKFINKKKLSEMKTDDLINLSYDQKKLLSLITEGINKQMLAKYMNFDNIFNNLTQNIYNLHFIALSYKIYELVHSIMLRNKTDMYPFGNTFMSIHRNNSFDINDDDNDAIIIIDKPKFKQTITAIVNDLLNANLQVFANYDSKYIQIMRNDVQPLYYFKNRDKTNYMIFSKFINCDFTKLKYINVSLYSPTIDEIVEQHNIKLLPEVHETFENCHYIKVPWLDIFFAFRDKDKLCFSGNNYTEFALETFHKKQNILNMLKKDNSTHLQVVNKVIPFQNADRFINEYYHDPTKINKYVIKNKHSSAEKQRSIIFQIDYTAAINKFIIDTLFNYTNDIIKTYFDIIDLKDHLCLLIDD